MPYHKIAFDPEDGTTVCYDVGTACFSPAGGSFTASVPPDTTHYDANLAEASKEIDTILRRASERAPKGKHLSIVLSKAGLALVWARGLRIVDHIERELGLPEC